VCGVVVFLEFQGPDEHVVPHDDVALVAATPLTSTPILPSRARLAFHGTNDGFRITDISDPDDPHEIFHAGTQGRAGREAPLRACCSRAA
jgi:hypothetical protein